MTLILNPFNIFLYIIDVSQRVINVNLRETDRNAFNLRFHLFHKLKIELLQAHAAFCAVVLVGES